MGLVSWYDPWSPLGGNQHSDKRVRQVYETAAASESLWKAYVATWMTFLGEAHPDLQGYWDLSPMHFRREGEFSLITITMLLSLPPKFLYQERRLWFGRSEYNFSKCSYLFVWLISTSYYVLILTSVSNKTNKTMHHLTEK